MTDFTVHKNEPVALSELVARLNAVPLITNSVKYTITMIPPGDGRERSTWCGETVKMIKRYNLYVDDSQKCPIPKQEVRRDNNSVGDVLVFQDEEAIYQLQKLGIETHNLTAKMHLKPSLIIYGKCLKPFSPGKQVSRMVCWSYGHASFEQVSNSLAQAVVKQNLSSAFDLMRQHSETHKDIFNDIVLHEGDDMRITFKNACSKTQLTELAGLGLTFPRHELYKRLYDARHNGGEQGPHMTITCHMPLILASGSAIRQQMLKEVGLRFSVMPSGVDEEALKPSLFHLPATQKALELAKAKALWVSQKYPEALTIGADQICSLGETIFDKPGTHEKAEAQLTALSGKTHSQTNGLVITKGNDVLWSHISEAKLTVRNLSTQEVKKYIAADAPLSSCGAYKLESLGRHLFSHIEGDHDTVKGLALVPLLTELHRMGAISLV